MSSPIPTLREYGAYLESLDRPLDLDALFTGERPLRRDGVTTPSLPSGQAMPLLRAVPDAAKALAVVEVEPARRGPSAPRRWLVAAAAVAAVVLLIVGALVLQPTGGDHVRTRPAGPAPAATAPTTVPDVEPPPSTLPGDGSTTGLLLPEGAPSTPHAGELVAMAMGEYALYADGRLISVNPGEPRDGQWVERRLTPEAVERVRRALLASGAFDAAGPPPDDQPLCTCVRGDDGELLAVPNPPPAAARLVPAAAFELLPEAEWVDREAKPYVASRIRVCAGTFADVTNRVVRVPHDPSVLVPLLPGPAAALLAGRATPASPFDPPEASCFEVTLDEARSLADELLRPSVGGSHEYWGIVLRDPRFDAVDPAVREGIVVYVSFQELLPDGAPAVTGG